MKMFLAGAVSTLTIMAGWAAWSQGETFPLAVHAYFAGAISPSGNAVPIQADEQGRVFCSPLVP